MKENTVAKIIQIIGWAQMIVALITIVFTDTRNVFFVELESHKILS